MTEAVISRVEQGFNLNWCHTNPELFAEAVLNLLEGHPPEKWNIAIKPAYMPGEKYMIVCTLKEIDE